MPGLLTQSSSLLSLYFTCSVKISRDWELQESFPTSWSGACSQDFISMIAVPRPEFHGDTLKFYGQTVSVVVDCLVNKTHVHLTARLPTWNKTTFRSFVHLHGLPKDGLFDWGSLFISCSYVYCLRLVNNSWTPKVLAMVLYPRNNIYTKWAICFFRVVLFTCVCVFMYVIYTYTS